MSKMPPRDRVETSTPVLPKGRRGTAISPAAWAAPAAGAHQQGRRPRRAHGLDKLPAAAPGLLLGHVANPPLDAF